MIPLPTLEKKIWQLQIEKHWPRLIERIEDGRAWNKPRKWQPIQVNPSITAHLLRQRTAPWQRSEWFGIEMEERESYSFWTLPPFLHVKNLDKEDLPWFGSEKYLSRKSEVFFCLFLKSSHFYLSFLIFQYGTDPVLWLQSCCFLHIPYRFVCILFQECVAGGFSLCIFKWGYLRIQKPKRVEARTVIDRKIVTELPDILNASPRVGEASRHHW